MTDQLPNSSSVPTAVDTAASNACTRSGTFALVLSVALLLLIPYWVERPREIALGRYISERLNLATLVDSLDVDPLWQRYKDSQKQAESMSIAQLLGVSVEVTDKGKTQWTPPAPDMNESQHQGVSTSRPQAPQMLSVTMSQRLNEIPQIADILGQLNDPELLTDSMKVSNFFTFSIARWGQKRNNLMYQNAFLHSCTESALEVPSKTQKSDYFVPLLDKGALLKCLTFGDVRELAHFELPTFSNPLQLEGRIRRDIDVKPGSLPADLYMASAVGQLLLFFVVMYFGAFAYEAVSSATFPAEGTLFGAFCRSRWTLLVFFLALWSPLVTSLGLAAASRKWPLVICSALICYAVLSAHLVVQRKSYFADLKPLLFWGGKRPTKNSSSLNL